jgi:hypothetical protein
MATNQQPQTAQTLSLPAQSSQPLPAEHQPEVPQKPDWSRYTAYRCIICRHECINPRDSPYAEETECRRCHLVPSLD